ncbi:MAG TPA: hypothetical protein VGH02_03405 [Rhizomicrobium sp.]
MLSPLKALFWICVVAMLMPQHPDLGVSRPPDAAAMVRRAIGAEISSIKEQLDARRIGPSVVLAKN